MQGVYSFAKVNFLIEYKYRYTRELFKAYETCGEPSAVITLSDSDYEFEKQKSKAPIEYLENLAILRKIIKVLLNDFSAVLFHGSAVEYRGNGYLFTAPSGTGKSTHARYLKEYLGDVLNYINDDKPIIRVENGTVLVCGSAWNGKHGIGSNICVPLKAVCLLKRGNENKIEPLSNALAIKTLFEQTVSYSSEEEAVKLLNVLSKIVESVNFYTLYCVNDISSAKTSHEGMML
ncbi:MAG: hypothetical protein IKL82_04810 [Clostridia bacterium]|nr:hypothetical protein [Clostridia bacterium]